VQGEGCEGGIVKFRVLECDQRSDEWRTARAGRLTGSRAAEMLAKIKTGEAAARRDLRMQLVCERLTGIPQDDDYVNREMQRGIDLEPEAYGEYEAVTGTLVERSGFITCDEIMAGCSLDGHVGDFDGIVEVKCPKSATHLRYLQGGLVPSEYLPQLRHNAWVTGAKWADFVSYDNRFPEDLRFFRVRIGRDKLNIEAYEKEALAFLAEVDKAVASVTALREVA
jgi:predicted phage-related endonuclease